MQFMAIVLVTFITLFIWSSFLELKNPNFDDSLSIYRFSHNNTDVRLFNISGNIIPPNGTFVHLEKIPKRELNFDADIFCLSEFEYRSDESQIFFNAVQLAVVSNDGHFCVSRTGPDFLNYCSVFYTFKNFVLYYAYVDPITGEVYSFSEECLAILDRLSFHSGPVADFNMDVNQHISGAGFAGNTKLLIIYYQNLVGTWYLNVSTILSAPRGEFAEQRTFQGPSQCHLSNSVCVFKS